MIIEITPVIIIILLLLIIMIIITINNINNNGNVSLRSSHLIKQMLFKVMLKSI